MTTFNFAMDIQLLIVIAIVAAAVAYGALILFRKRRSFSTKGGCASDCGCSGASKKLTS